MLKSKFYILTAKVKADYVKFLSFRYERVNLNCAIPRTADTSDRRWAEYMSLF